MRPAILALVALTTIAAPGRAAAQGPDLPPPNPRPRIEARRATAPIRLDGRLDEADWLAAPSIGGMTQVEPQTGSPSRYRASIRVLFDADNLYFGIFGGDSLGLAGIRVQDFKRDFDFGPNDFFAVTMDPTGAGKYNQAFQISPWGTMKDLEAFDGGQDFNEAWDGLWRSEVQRTDSGYTAELAIPWKTLRYVNDGRPWLLNFYRMARRTNEFSGWSPWARAITPHRTAYMGELVGLEPPPPSTNVRFRPYTIGEVTSEGTGARCEVPLGRYGGEVTWAP
ncbi:MAG: carbohydrate binding family 9 domain-containing protein, partial [Gemmatimonadetes bacterium]|nr:carbohydrate binding family 9 domain-containing protein [Gemmatimonadota bacterium]